VVNSSVVPDENTLKSTEIEEPQNNGPPEDKHNIIYWSCFVYGMVMLIPWNCVVSTVPFYESSLPNTNIVYMISFAMNGVMAIVTILCVIFADPA
jgi:hypothetical protein